ncbi:MAG: DUF1569 domain-containing protein [Pirellulales bacterium]
MNAPQATPRRRPLRFESIDEVAADVDRIVAAQHAGHLVATGNWTPAQIFEHLARFIEFSYEGFPFRASWPVRAVSYVAKWVAWRRFVDWALRPGFRIPHDALRPDDWADFDVATARLRAQLTRIRRGEPMTKPSPFEGSITHDQWVYVHLRHAALHLSFLDFPR